jgi:hypothetical protein
MNPKKPAPCPQQLAGPEVQVRPSARGMLDLKRAGVVCKRSIHWPVCDRALRRAPSPACITRLMARLD